MSVFTRQYKKTQLILNALLLCVLVFFSFTKTLPIAEASMFNGTIDETYRYAWGENVGWVDFGSTTDTVYVTDSALTGSAYGENIGWIILNPSGYGGVTNDAEGNLAGYAWGENVGWIDFSDVTINENGEFIGGAYGENIGWITFATTTENKVVTDWRPASVRPPAITLSGTIYTDQGTTELNSAGKSVEVKVDGAGAYSTTTVAGSGDWYIDNVVVSTSSVVTVFIDNDPTFSAVTLTVASSSVNNLTNLDLYQNHVIIRHENSASSTDLTHLATYDSTDNASILYTASTTTSSLIVHASTTLYIAPNTTFAPQGTVTILGGTGHPQDGTLYLPNNATYIPGGNTTLAGSYFASSSATFTPNLHTLTFTATSSGHTVHHTPTSSLGNVTFNGVDGAWTFTHNATTTNFTVATGTVTAPDSLTVQGTFVNHGTFIPQQGTVLLSGTEHTLTGTTTFYNLTKIATTTATTTFEAGSLTTVQNTLTLTGTTSAIHNLRSSAEGQYWYIDPQGTRSVSYLDVKDSYNLSETTIVCGSTCLDSTGNIAWLFVDPILTLADHSAGQVKNAFSFQNKTNEPLFAFRLEPDENDFILTSLALGLNGTREFTDTFSNIRLYRDHNNNAEYNATDELITTGTLTYDYQTRRGFITFNETFTATTSQNYLVVADWTYPTNGTFLNFTLTSNLVTGYGIVTGAVKNIQHHRNNRGGGSDIGTPAPEGRRVVTGGSNDGGEQIGDDPDFRWPTANSGDWNNAIFASDKVDGTYATTSTSSATHNYLNYGWSINSNNTVDGIIVKLEVSGTTALGNIGVSLSWDGGETWTETKNTPTLTTTDAVVTLGSVSDRWGRATWGPSDFSNTNFRVRLTANPDGNVVQVDALQVKVYHYSTGGGAGGGVDI